MLQLHDCKYEAARCIRWHNILFVDLIAIHGLLLNQEVIRCHCSRWQELTKAKLTECIENI